VVIFGGTADRCFNGVFSFSVGAHQWTRYKCSGASPSPRFDYAACRVAESMYIFGGNTENDSLNNLWEYALDTRTWTQVVNTTGSGPSPRVSHPLVPFGNRLVVFGGCDPHVANMASSFDSALHCFDLQGRCWSCLAIGGVLPRARSSHAAIPCRGGFLIFGGRGLSNEHLNDTFLLRVWS